MDQAVTPSGAFPGRPGPRPTPAAPTAPRSDAEPGADESELAQPVLNGELDARIAAIESLPLAERAAAYSQLHDSLRDHLEGGDVPRSKAE
jgi:hypothetical protein